MVQFGGNCIRILYPDGNERGFCVWMSMKSTGTSRNRLEMRDSDDGSQLRYAYDACNRTAESTGSREHLPQCWQADRSSGKWTAKERRFILAMGGDPGTNKESAETDPAHVPCHRPIPMTVRSDKRWRRLDSRVKEDGEAG